MTRTPGYTVSSPRSCIRHVQLPIHVHHWMRFFRQEAGTAAYGTPYLLYDHLPHIAATEQKLLLDPPRSHPDHTAAGDSW